MSKYKQYIHCEILICPPIALMMEAGVYLMVMYSVSACFKEAETRYLLRKLCKPLNVDILFRLVKLRIGKDKVSVNIKSII
jgi:hypothetical protein